jgi:ABC-type enterobactin transport system permease subunit
MPFNWGAFFAVLVAVPLGAILGGIVGAVLLELLGSVDVDD